MRNDNEPVDLATPEQAFQQQLRQATNTVHQKLEGLPISRSLMNDRITLEQYLFYLQCMKDVVSFFDDVILPQIKQVLEDAPARRKLPAIVQDIQLLQKKVRCGKPLVPLVIPEVTGIAKALGMAYVIEGSTLGGRIILKHIAAKLHLNSLDGASFFDGYGQQTGTMWKLFMQTLSEYAIREQQEQKIIDGAVECFVMIHSHFLKNSNDSEN